ncbi:hypothetical protein [Nocardia sp. NPDC057455]|uniref:hypothetical protein n=1 Tax=Nocardia sp. NPDC057455 TaxID=3346138 RepID=UPI0036728324
MEVRDSCGNGTPSLPGGNRISRTGPVVFRSSVLGVPRDWIFIGKGFSGTTRKNRTGLDNALAAFTSAAAAVTDRRVVPTTTKFDRFARNMAEAEEILTGIYRATTTGTPH